MMPDENIRNAVAFGVAEGIIPAAQSEKVFDAIASVVREFEERGVDTTEYEVYGFELVDGGDGVKALVGPPFTPGAGPLRSMFPTDTTVFDPINLSDGAPETDSATSPYDTLFTDEGYKQVPDA
jgi:hypothetical protein